MNCSRGRGGGGWQNSCENTSVGLKGSFSHQASPFKADSYVIMMPQEPRQGVSTILNQGGPACFTGRRAKLPPPQCGNWQVGCGSRSEVKAASEPEKWIPEAGGSQRQKEAARGHRRAPHGTRRAAGQRQRGPASSPLTRAH